MLAVLALVCKLWKNVPFGTQFFRLDTEGARNALACNTSEATPAHDLDLRCLKYGFPQIIGQDPWEDWKRAPKKVARVQRKADNHWRSPPPPSFTTNAQILSWQNMKFTKGKEGMRGTLRVHMQGIDETTSVDLALQP